MRRMLNSAQVSFFAFATTVSGFASANDGVIPPGPNDTGYTEFHRFMEALGGFGKTQNLSSLLEPTSQENNTICGGLLVAPNIVLTAKHCISDARFLDHWSEVVSAVDSNGNPDRSVPEMWFDFNANPPIPRYTVRFRLLNDQGDVGTLSGGYETFYQAPVKRVVMPAENHNQTNTHELDMVLLILSDGADDQETNGLWSNGWIEHITPVSILPTLHRSSIPFTGTAATYGPTSTGGARGILRLREETDLFFGDQDFTDCITYLRNLPSVLVGDSGGAVFSENEAGEYISSWGVAYGGGGLAFASCLPGSLTWDLFYPSTPHVFGSPSLYPESSLDVTGSPAATSPQYYAGYNTPNWTINSDDVIAMAALSSSIDAADWDGNGVVNILDFKQYASELSQAINPYASNPLFPLPAGLGDVDGDLRLTLADSVALEELVPVYAMEDLIYDFNGNGQIDTGDAAILERVVTTEIGPNQDKIFDHGIAGDTDGNGEVDCDDLIGLPSLLFDGTERADIPASGYQKKLDYNMNQILDGYDKRYLAARLNPGDLSTGYVILATDDTTLRFGAPSNTNPDFEVGAWEARQYFSRTNNKQDTTGRIGADVVGSGWVAGGAFVHPDGLVTYEDRIYTLTNWLTNCNASFQTSSLLDFWFFDHNSDGRVNFLDARSLEDFIDHNPSVYDPEWDLNADGVNDSFDVRNLFTTVHLTSAYGQGFLGDVDGSGSPVCIDECSQPGRPHFSLAACEDVSTNTCAIPTISIGADCDDLVAIRDDLEGFFESGLSFGDPDFKVQLDADLDGELDLDDQIAVLLFLQPADLVTDGFVNFFDISFFLEAYAAQDPSADFNGDGQFNFFDISAFLEAEAAACD